MSRRALPDLPPLRVELVALVVVADTTIDPDRLEGLLIGARDAGMPWRQILAETARMLTLGHDLYDLDNAFTAWRKAHPSRPAHNGAELARQALAQTREAPMSDNPPNTEEASQP